jgi:hypothetical protein
LELLENIARLRSFDRRVDGSIHRGSPYFPFVINDIDREILVRSHCVRAAFEFSKAGPRWRNLATRP